MGAVVDEGEWASISMPDGSQMEISVSYMRTEYRARLEAAADRAELLAEEVRNFQAEAESRAASLKRKVAYVEQMRDEVIVMRRSGYDRSGLGERVQPEVEQALSSARASWDYFRTLLREISERT